MMIERPSDEVTGKVLQAQLDLPPCMMNIDLSGSSIIGLITIDGRAVDIKDPRDDTDAALELLWHNGIRLHPIHSISKGEGWIAVGLGCDKQEWLPISGQPLRYAIVHLAAKVLGVEA